MPTASQQLLSTIAVQVGSHSLVDELRRRMLEMKHAPLDMESRCL